MNLSYQVPLQGFQLLSISLQVISRARKTGRALSLFQWKTPIEANSAEASDKSNLDTPDLKRKESVKEIMQEIKEGKSERVYM